MEVTDEYIENAFQWTRDSGDIEADAVWNVAHAGMKAITLTEADLNGDIKLTCTLTASSATYGSVTVDDDMDASHNPAELDANDVFAIENGNLKVTTSRGNAYVLENGALKASGSKLNGSITAETKLFASQPEDIVEFSYNHNGLRTQKKVTKADGTVETTDYTLHGEMLTHLTRGNDTMHFFYDNEKRPTMVEFNSTLYSYIHNLQGDIVGILDSAGNLVVEYKYDAWGKPVAVRTLTTAYEKLAVLNPFRYRGYVYDEEMGLYYLRSRLYSTTYMRFVNCDGAFYIYGGVTKLNSFAYCLNSPLKLCDNSGNSPSDATKDNTSEVQTLLNRLWEIAHDFVRKSISTFVSTIRSMFKYIPKEAEVEYTIGARYITTTDIATQRRAEQIVSLWDPFGIPMGVADWTDADEFVMNPGLYGVVTYKFTWSVEDGSGEVYNYFAVVEQLYTPNTDPETADENPVIGFFIPTSSLLPDIGNMQAPLATFPPLPTSTTFPLIN